MSSFKSWWGLGDAALLPSKPFALARGLMVANGHVLSTEAQARAPAITYSLYFSWLGWLITQELLQPQWGTPEDFLPLAGDTLSLEPWIPHWSPHSYPSLQKPRACLDLAQLLNLGVGTGKKSLTKLPSFSQVICHNPLQLITSL